MGDTSANENSDSSEEQKIENKSNLTDGENQKKQRTRKIVKKEMPIDENSQSDSKSEVKEVKSEDIASKEISVTAIGSGSTKEKAIKVIFQTRIQLRNQMRIMI